MNNNSNNDVKCCEFLLHQLCFFFDSIGPCCSRTIHHSSLRVELETNNEQPIDLSKYLEIRSECIKKFKNGKQPFCYEGCFLYESLWEHDESLTLNNIVISNRTYCNCRCIYCEHSGKSEEMRNWLNSHKPYDILPILKYLKNKNLISEGCKFIVCGGDLAEYPKEELEWIFDLAKEVNGSLLLLSSGIRYSETIANALKTQDTFITISPDSATKEIYEKIKQVKAFNVVWDNLKKYIEAAKNNKKGIVEIKYIVIPGINDSIEEAKKFIEKCESINCEYIKAEIEHFWMHENFDKPMPDYLKEIFKYFYDTTSKKGLNFVLEGVGREWIIQKINE